jgi:hypothetical protein
VGLVCDNLRVELQEKPWKVIKMVDFILNDVPRANNDFTRLKLTEGVIPLFTEVGCQELFPALISQALRSEKETRRLMESSLVIEASEDEEDRAVFDFSELTHKGVAVFLTDLIENYQPLLAEN